MPMSADSRLVLCQCAYSATVPPDTVEQVRQRLDGSGFPHESVPDLCELAARKSPLLAELAGAARLTVVACHRRAIKWLFAAGEAPLRDDAVTYLDMRATPAEKILYSIRETAGSMPSSTPHRDTAGEKVQGWNPWFPVIDYGRCENCQQCLGFCLFGVYTADAEGMVRVSSPTNCKTGCPACARVCPSAAIIFPKYLSAPINGGEVRDDAPAGEPVQVDKATLLNGDVLKVLQDRGKDGGRFAARPDQVQAVQERLAAVVRSQRPPDVPLSALIATPPAKTEPV